MNRRNKAILENRNKKNNNKLEPPQDNMDTDPSKENNLQIKSKTENFKKEESIEKYESPPSNYTGFGIETKKWIKGNPVLTRTLERKLQQNNIPVLRKIKALDQARTPKKLLPSTQTGIKVPMNLSTVIDNSPPVFSTPLKLGLLLPHLKMSYLTECLSPPQQYYGVG